jgi:hypothetical protein
LRRKLKPFALLYDTYKVHFSPKRFIWQFFLQTFAPLSLPLMPNLRASGFISYNPMLFMNCWLTPVVVAVMLASSALCRPGSLGHAVYCPLAFFLMHRMMIALKYATMSL